MLNKIKEHILLVAEFEATSLELVEKFRIDYLGKKGILNDFFAAFKEVPNTEKKEFGQLVNELKNKAQEKVNQLKEKLEESNRKYRAWIRLNHECRVYALRFAPSTFYCKE